ncbi:MAG: DUF2325 domain-containing protein [Gammaproteobacteria bacterium]|nr:DUF2325 domain-containing protein [Gammaproteobacteria bacterium]
MPGQAQYFLIELDRALSVVRIRDHGTLEVLAELDGPTSRALLGDDKAVISADATAALTAAVYDKTRPVPMLEPAPGGLTSQVRKRQLARTEQRSGRKTRRKLWELPHKLHCPVIGTCLEADELRRIALKAGARPSGELTDYDVHVSFVAAADEKNSLSLATHKALDKKYASHVKRFSRARTDADLTAAWEDGLARGDVPGALWATLTHARCDDALKARTFEEIHMLSHQIGAGQRADLKRLTEAEQELRTLQHDFDAAQGRQRRQLEEREQRILELERELAETHRHRRELAARETQFVHDIAELRNSSTQQRVELLTTELLDRERRLAGLQQQSEAMEAALSSAEQELSDAQTENAELVADCSAMERFITRSLDICENCEGPEPGDNPDLGGRRILCVGGRNRLIEHYRELVTRCNGRFEHYDGGLEDNRQRLDALLSSADAVVCATDSVSHDAYYRLKRFCKRNETPHVFLRNSGISSFTRALYGMSSPD